MKVQCGPGRWPKMLECMLCMRGPQIPSLALHGPPSTLGVLPPLPKVQCFMILQYNLELLFFFSTGEISDGVMPLFSLCKILTWVITSLCEHLHVNVCCLIRLHAPGVWLFIFKSSNQGVWNIRATDFIRKERTAKTQSS